MRLTRRHRSRTRARSITDLTPGAYTLREDDVAGYTEGDWSCTTGAPYRQLDNAGTVTLDQGPDRAPARSPTTTSPPSLTLVKRVVNDDGGDATVDDFNVGHHGRAR